MPLDFLWNTAGTNLLVYFPPAVIQQTADTLHMGDPTKIAFAPRFDFRDPQIAQLSAALLREMENTGLGGPNLCPNTRRCFSDICPPDLCHNHAAPRSAARHKADRRVVSTEFSRELGAI